MELSQNAASSAGVSKVRNESFAAVVEGGADASVDGAALDPALGGAEAELGADVEQPAMAKTAVAATASIRRRRGPVSSTASSSDDGDSGRRTVTRRCRRSVIHLDLGPSEVFNPNGGRI